MRTCVFLCVYVCMGIERCIRFFIFSLSECVTFKLNETIGVSGDSVVRLISKLVRPTSVVTEGQGFSPETVHRKHKVDPFFVVDEVDIILKTFPSHFDQ